ncbi:MAG TPA: GspE/PulE family protein [Chthoniobacteraceae bacterium]|jgi:type II secretory ATPase GspE/PulE/Tfp pilus assembly ATPase PilB-like protein|nr:Secretion system protein [Chthoniobacter sp.]HEV7869309.1 GspE/PulE family protein [Chthoniobacteraceae bacterium]
MTSRKALVDVLRATGLEDEAAIELAALQPAPGSSWTTEVLNTGKVDEHKLAAELAKLFRSPVGNVEAQKIERSVLGLLPSRFVFKHQILPLAVTETTVKLATFDVFNQVSRRLAQQQLNGKKIDWVIVPRGQLLRTIKALYGVGAETFEEILQSTRTYDDNRDDTQDITGDDPEASVVKFVNQVIREAIFERATDIHVEPLENDLRIRYRIDGILHEVAVPPQLRVLQSAIISRLKVMAHMDIAERRLPQDGRINLNTSTGAIDVRVSTIPTVNGESISLRLLSRSETLAFGIDRLDMSEKQVSVVKKLLQHPNGIILVTGPTGSGKSTSLYSFLTSINAVSRRIITIEEPVEYRLPGVSQIDVKAEIGLTFANGLRAILRQDPNIVMVGEIRDFETAEIAIRAAMTGHLVFSTLHTNDAVSGITRLLDMGIEPFLLASVVRCFLAQRLVRTICPDCTEETGYPVDYLREIGAPLPEDLKFYHGRGCEHCRQTGYRGRSAIYEICVVNENLRRMVIRKETGTAMKQRAIADGMDTLRNDGWRRVLKGQTTVEEVVRVTQQDEALAETD